jgi:hypothetical protein
MIPVSLPSGKVRFITFEESLDDDFMQRLIAEDEGYEFDNPFDPKVDHIRENKLWEVPEAPELTQEQAKKIERKERGKDQN